MNIISVDLNWKPNPPKADRVAVTIADENGYVKAVIGELCDSELLRLMHEFHPKRNTPSIILLDIPIDGCKRLNGNHFRPVDRALVSNGIPLLPSSKAGQRGSLLKKEILAATGKKARIFEIYPYAVYKFISYLRHKGTLPSFGSPTRHSRAVLLDGQFRTYWPPRYKREPKKGMRVKYMRHVLSLLTDPQVGLTFSSPLQAPNMSGNLSTLADRYDSCLGAIVGIHLANKSPFAKIVGDKYSGEILLLADRWLVENLKKSNIRISA